MTTLSKLYLLMYRFWPRFLLGGRFLPSSNQIHFAYTRNWGEERRRAQNRALVRVVCKIPLLARALGLKAEQRNLVYKIPYRRARAWPSAVN